MKQHRVLIVGSHPLFCQGIKNILEACADIKVVGVGSEREWILRVMKRQRPDVVIADDNEARSEDSNPVPVIAQANHSVRIILLTLEDNTMSICRGQFGHSIDNARAQDLIAAIKDA
ncbi:MAG: hypothetical protein M1358_02930 [Chloroflexi bacterium]|nr:hypothetical protein [Chloroflexota bacterium]